MQLSDREIQNTIDLLKKRQAMGEVGPSVRSPEDVEAAGEAVKRIQDMPDPDFRRERVEKLKKALESSSYDVSGEDVAKKLIGRFISDKIR